MLKKLTKTALFYICCYKQLFINILKHKQMKITELEKSFMLDAVNSYWVQSIQELGRKDLGDIERKNWEAVKKQSSELMAKWDEL